jgi:hypothetical protein
LTTLLRSSPMADAADAWFAEHDPEGVAFAYAVLF